MSIRFFTLAALVALVVPAVSAQTLLYQQPSGFADAEGRTVSDTQGWIYSENLTVAANDGVDSYLADDFTVPLNDNWSISEVSVLAFYLDGSADAIQKATSFNVILWNNDAAAGTPDTELFRVDGVTPTSDNTGGEGVTGILSFSLSGVPVLTAGTYWVTVQANMASSNLEEDTRYFWGSNDAAFGQPVQWWNYGAGLTAAAPCDQDWGDNTPECGNENRNDNDPSVYFRLTGSITVASEEAAQSQTVSILPTRPNPAVGRTLVPFTLREASDVSLAVYDVLGRQVALIADRAYGAGEHAETLDTASFAPGTYVVRLTAGADVVLRTISVTR